MSNNPVLLWSVFNVVLAVMLYLDLWVVNRRAHVISIKEAAIWSSVWVAVSLIFCGWVGVVLGKGKALEFLTGYVIEKSLSIDNLFVFIMIFSYFQVSAKNQPRVLKCGILGALVLRLIIILMGIELIETFHWVIYVFGVFLVFTGVRMAVEHERKIEPEKNPILKIFKRMVPISTKLETAPSFFIKQNGIRYATPLFVALLVIEISDIIFAVDSIPAVLAISTDPFIVYTSNAFAILGLRALYFLLSGIMRVFTYLKYGICVVLVFVGIKMCLIDIAYISVLTSLTIIGTILTLSILASFIFKPKVK